MLYGRYNEAMIKTELTVHSNYGNEQALEVQNVLSPYYLLISFNDIHDSIYDGVSSSNFNINQINKFIQQ
jgi:hypothetical protein